MAPPRFATLRQIEIFADPHGPDNIRALTFQPPPGEPLGFVGGQFIIVDTGQVAASGKAIKRAYSILSADADQSCFVLATRRIGAGPGSAFMHQLVPGDVIKFSGPWGKLIPAPERGGRTLVLATDTGITAALGLVQGQRFAPLLAGTRLLWLRPGPRDFVPESFVRPRLPPGLGSCEIGLLPPPGHPERLAHVQAVLGADLQPGRVAQIFITGDGAINYALLDHYLAAGVVATRDNVESFFNYPKKIETPVQAA